MATRTSLYRHFDASGELLYVGVSISAFARLEQHASSAWFKSIARMDVEHFESRDAALIAERDAIMREHPKHNVKHKRSAEVTLGTNDEAFTLGEFERSYRVSHTKTAELIKTGQLPTYKLGRRRYINRLAAEQWQRNLEIQTLKGAK